MSDTPVDNQENVAQQPPAPGVISDQEVAGVQAMIASRLAASISPMIARELMTGKISFAALTVVVDDKYSGTFPFYQIAPQTASEQDKFGIKLSNIKSTMLAAVEFAKVLGFFKNKVARSFDEGYLDPPK